MAKLVVLTGVPGSGKSYFSDVFHKKMGGHLYIVSSDMLRYEVCGNQQNFEFDKLVWRMFYGMIRVYSMDKNGIVILDATNSICKYRVSIIEPFKKLFDQIHLVAFNLDKDVVRNQNINRAFPVPCEVLEDLFLKYEQPNEFDKNFFDNIYYINNHDILPVIEDIINK